MTYPTPDQIRAMGYAANSQMIYLTEDAWKYFCAWIDKNPNAIIPAYMRYKPFEIAKAWERVAKVLK